MIANNETLDSLLNKYVCQKEGVESFSEKYLQPAHLTFTSSYLVTRHCVRTVFSKF